MAAAAAADVGSKVSTRSWVRSRVCFFIVPRLLVGVTSDAAEGGALRGRPRGVGRARVAVGEDAARPAAADGAAVGLRVAAHGAAVLAGVVGGEGLHAQLVQVQAQLLHRSL